MALKPLKSDRESVANRPDIAIQPERVIDGPGAHVVVLAAPFWVRRFGADPAIVGRTIRLNSEEYIVAGVIASGFALPVRDVDFVLPFAADRDPRRGARNSLNFIHGVGRIAAQSSQSQAASDLNAIARRLQAQFPVENARKRGVRMVAAIDGIARRAFPSQDCSSDPSPTA